MGVQKVLLILAINWNGMHFNVQKKILSVEMSGSDRSLLFFVRVLYSVVSGAEVI